MSHQNEVLALLAKVQALTLAAERGDITLTPGQQQYVSRLKKAIKYLRNGDIESFYRWIRLAKV